MKIVSEGTPQQKKPGPNTPHHHVEAEKTMKVMAFDDVITVAPLEENEVLLSYLSPVWQLSDNVEVVLLGELDKYVPISPERIKAVDFHEPRVVHLRVEVGDFIAVTAQ